MKLKRALALGLLASLTFPMAGVSVAHAEPSSDTPVTVTSEQVRVIVMLKDQPTNPSARVEKSLISTQVGLINAWKDAYGLEVGRHFGFLINGFSATIPADKINELAAQPEVASVKRERTYYPTEYNGREMEGVPAAYANYGVDGEGMVVSIIDTGIDMNHQDMRLDAGVCENSKLEPAEGFTCKVPNGFNYADENYEVKDLTTSQHGMHVAGIVAANGSETDETPDTVATGRFDGVAPNAQLLAMKVFSNHAGSGAYDSDIIAAIEDSYKLGADVINMSLGSPNGQKDASDGAYRAMEIAREHGVLTVVSAGNDGLNFSPDGTTTDLFGQLDDATVGAPGTQGSAFTVASIDNNLQLVPVAFYNDGTDHEITFLPQGVDPDGQSYELVDVGLSRAQDYPAGLDLTGKYALVERGENTFTDKFQNAVNHGASGIVVFNSEAGGNDFVAMGGIEQFDIFSASIYREDGLAIREALGNGTVTVRFTNDLNLAPYAEGLTPSNFTSWGPTPTLDFEPEISGIGGSVYSTLNDNKYGSMSGTSMAAPNVAGLSALLMEHYKTTQPDLTGPALLDRVTTVLMNTAVIPRNAEGVPFAPRQIGAGLANIENALETPVYALVDGEPSVALREVNSNRTFTVTLTNTSDADVTYTVPAQEVVNETNEAEGDTTTFVSGESLTPNKRSVTVPAGGSATVDFTLVPETSSNHYIEGWARFVSDSAPDISVPYMGFVGDWNAELIVAEPGQPWLEGVNDSYTGLVTSWAGMTIPLDMMADWFGQSFFLSPNGDGDIDQVVPNLLLMRNASDAKYEVYTADGELVKVIGQEQALYRTIAGDHIAEGYETAYMATSQGFDGTTWDPAKGDFVAVPDGDYIYRVSTRLGPNFDWQVTDLPFSVDGTAPEFVFGELVDGVLTFEVIKDGSGIMDLPTITTDGGQELPVTMNDDGSFSVTVPEGVAYVTASVVDFGFNLGVGTKVFASQTLVVASADQLNTAILSPRSQIVDGGTLRLAGYVSSDIASVTINGEETELRNGRFTDWVELAEGPNEIVVIAYNEAGEEVDRQVVTPVYDSIPPVVEVTNASPDGTVALNDDGTLTITGTVTDEREGADLSVTIAGTAVEVAADGTFTHTFTPADDIATVTVVASDGANQGQTVVLIEGRVPAADDAWEAPAFTNIECLYGFTACFVPSDLVDQIDENTFLAKGQLNSEVSEFTLTPASYVGEDGQYVHPEPIVVTPAADGTFEVPLTLTTGMNDYRIYITDADGNVMVDESVKFYYDITAPSINFDEPRLIGGTLFTNQDEVTFAGTASDDGWGYQLLLNDSSVVEVYYNSGHGPESNEREFSAPVKVANGDMMLVVFNDAMGNALLGVIPVVVDKDAPHVTHAIGSADGEAADGAYLENNEPVVTTVTDENLSSLQVSLNGEVIATENANVTLSDVAVEDALLDAREIGDILDEDVVGSEAATLETTLSHELDTTDLAAGVYELTAVATDLAGNVTTSAITFTVDDAPVIEGPDSVDLAIDRELLGDQDALAAQVLENYSVIDDGAADGSGDATLALAPGTVLVEGENAVVLQATDSSGVRTEREVTVQITLNVRTLEDQGVTATGTFRSDDSLTVTKSGTDEVTITYANEFATLPATITIPAIDGKQLFKVVGDGGEAAVAVDPVDGVYTLETTSKGIYVFKPVKDPVVPDPIEETPAPVNPPQKGNLFFVTNSWLQKIAENVFAYGREGDEVLIGDWNGDGKDTIGLRRGNRIYLTNALRGGNADIEFTYGRAGDEIIVGDWDGDGVDTIGVRRGDRFYLKNDFTSGNADVEFTFGKSGDEILVGDWNGDGKDSISVRRGYRFFIQNSLSSGWAEQSFVYGQASDEVFVGDWDGDGYDTVTLRRGAVFHVKNSLGIGNADYRLRYGRVGDKAYVGDWDGDGIDTPVVNRYVG